MWRAQILIVPVCVAVVGWFAQPMLGASVELVDDDRVSRVDARLTDEAGTNIFGDRETPPFGDTARLTTSLSGNSPDNVVSGQATASQDSTLRFTGITDDDDDETIGDSFQFNATLNGSAIARDDEPRLVSPVGADVSGISRFDVRVSTDDFLRVSASGTARAEEGARVIFRAFDDITFDTTLGPNDGVQTTDFDGTVIVPPGEHRIFGSVRTSGGEDGRFPRFDGGNGSLQLTVRGDTIEASRVTVPSIVGTPITTTPIVRTPPVVLDGIRRGVFTTDLVFNPTPAAIGPGLVLLGALALRRRRRASIQN